MEPVRAFRRFGRLCLTIAGRSPLGGRALAITLEDPEILRTTLNQLSDRIAGESFVEKSLPRGLKRIESFEDCVWLLSSNVVNNSAARLMLDEAAHLFATVRKINKAARVVEIGRFRGGTTVLLAAAGAEVLSIDIDERLRPSDDSLRAALSKLGLETKVELVFADSTSYPTMGRSVDLVFVDGDHSYDGVSRDVANWLPALRRDGLVLLHDAKFPEPSRPWNRPPDAAFVGVRRCVEELRVRPDLVEMDAPGTLAQFRYTGS